MMKLGKYLLISIPILLVLAFLAYGVTDSSAATPAPGIRVPAMELDTNEIFFAPGGTLGQRITRDRYWWYRPDIESDVWPYSGVLFEGESCNGCTPFPETIDSMAYWRYNDNGTQKIAQTVTSGSHYWHRLDALGQPTVWDGSGSLETDTYPTLPDCPSPKQGVDTMTVYPSDPNTPLKNDWYDYAQLTTKGKCYWYRENLQADWSHVGYLFSNATCSGCTFPDNLNNDPLDSFTVFVQEGKIAQLATRGNEYWFTANVNISTSTWTKGQLTLTVHPDSNTSGQIKDINRNIFGANLVWHPPHAGDFATVTSLIHQLQITTVRFPGGCGGDSYAYDWADTIGHQNPALRDYLDDGWHLWDGSSISSGEGSMATTAAPLNYEQLFISTDATPYYTLNLEGENNRPVEDMNCHGFGPGNNLTGLRDYEGTVGESVNIINDFNQDRPDTENDKIRSVEVGNEPWAGKGWGDFYYVNWREFDPGTSQGWTWDSYRTAYDSLVGNSNLPADVEFTLAWNNITSATLNQVSERVDYVQIHPYGCPIEAQENEVCNNYLSPLQRPNEQEGKILGLRRAISNSDHDTAGIAVTEYNMFCWEGVHFTDDGGISTTQVATETNTGKAEQGLYIAEMLGVFIKTGVDQAMIWHLVEDADSTWTCGLATEDGTLTPAGEVFELISPNMRGTYLPVDVSRDDQANTLSVIVAKNDDELKILVINSGSTPNDFTISIPNTSSLRRDTLRATNLNQTFTLESNIAVNKSADVYTISVPEYSVSMIRQPQDFTIFIPDILHLHRDTLRATSLN